MRNDLNRLSKIITASFSLDDGQVDLSGGVIGIGTDLTGCETFIVAKIQIGLGSIRRDIHFTVLERTHRSRINIDVWVELLQSYFQAMALQERTDGSARQALAQARNNSTGHEDVLRHEFSSVPFWPGLPAGLIPA